MISYVAYEIARRMRCRRFVCQFPNFHLSERTLMNAQLSTLRNVCVPFLLLAVFSATAPAQDIQASFEELAEKNAGNEIVELWKKSPFETLPTIDSYLEGSLKLVESSETPDQKAIDGMHAKALAGARAADEAFGSVIFSEYASSFIGWNREQQKQFRLGQKAYGDARTSLQSGSFDDALSAGKDCLAKAQPLGDWWGTAMGYSAIGAAQKGLGDTEKALTAYTSSRAIYHDLRLGGSELSCTVEMVALLKQSGNTGRAKVTCQQGIALAERLGNSSVKTQLSQTLATLK